ncbi:MAG: aminotransferase class V-fold PLP-dependent enzyme [Acidobacteriota bacterium]|nr:aminotransferase class V-fold PLP-dependent enzyme [Acidobacteriota bacterium]
MDEPRGAIYLDYAATTPVESEIVNLMGEFLGYEAKFGNPASRSHYFGQIAREGVELARDQVSRLINAEPYQIVWTSGATESINLAIKGAVRASEGRHIVASVLEHHAVLDTCAWLDREGYEVTYVEPNAEGLVTANRIRSALRSDTALVSVMHVNNEVGTVTDVGAIGEVIAHHDAVLHVDAAQSTARLPIDVRAFGVDLLSLSGHKMYGPKGVGALYVRDLDLIEQQMHGGDQEFGLRSGTLPTHQVVGMGLAAQMITAYPEKAAAVAELDRRLVERLTAIPRTSINGNPDRRVPGILSVAFEDVVSEALMMALQEEVAISSGSACTSDRVEPSHVLRGLDIDDDLAECSVRFSLGRYTTEDEIDRATERVAQAVNRLRAIREI